MKYFIAHLYFKIELETKKSPEYDHQLRLIRARNVNEALSAARDIGFKEETIFKNHYNKNVKWSFTGIPELTELPELLDEDLIYSRTVIPDNKNDFERYIQLKSNDLEAILEKKKVTFTF